MTEQQKWLFQATMEHLDAQYDAEAGMLTRRFGDREFHDLRGSCYYALGLLVRDEADDREKACHIIENVTSAQFASNPQTPFYGTFPFDDRVPEPPVEPYPFNAETRYYLEKWQEGIRGKFLRHLSENGYSPDQVREIEGLARQSLLETVPVVWGNFDANWRDFVATEFAMILIHGELKLPKPLVEKIENSAQKAVVSSIQRWNDHIIPMNTNVELMHVFICAYFGERLGREEYLQHAKNAARELLTRYQETDSFSEYNSPTYNSVDLSALTMWRLYIQDAEIRQAGAYLEAGLWENIAELYHPGLHNICGPYSRNYDNDMSVHSMIPALLYLAFGDEKPRPLFNVEAAGYIDLAITSTRIPETAMERMRTFQGERDVHKRFRELIERGKPGDDTTLCEVTAHLAENWMAGAMRGSRNTSGQLRSAVAFWKMPDGNVADMSLLRRMPGGREGEHLWTVYFDGKIHGNVLEMEVRPEVDRDIEVFFRVHGASEGEARIQPDLWKFPGMEIAVESNAGISELRTVGEDIEIVYPVKWREGQLAKLHFQLEFRPE